eukprot:SAG11_NODE_2091_length_3842_cov_1.651349_5_plen_84_part_00
MAGGGEGVPFRGQRPERAAWQMHAVGSFGDWLLLETDRLGKCWALRESGGKQFFCRPGHEHERHHLEKIWYQVCHGRPVPLFR